MESLVENTRVMMGDDHGRVVHIRGDTEAVYGEVVAVMDRLRSETGPSGKGGATRATAQAPAAAPAGAAK